jgi:tight adherence protein C
LNFAALAICVSAGLATAAFIAAVGRVRAREPFETTGLPAPLRAFRGPARVLAGAQLLRWPPAWERYFSRELARASVLGSNEAAEWVSLLLVQLAFGLVAMLLLAVFMEGNARALLMPLALAPAACSQSWLRSRGARRCSALVKALPSALDLLVLCLESGASIGTALRITHDKSAPGALRDLFGALLGRIRAGAGRSDACRDVMTLFDLPPVTGLLTALIQAETRGMSLGPTLRAQAAQCVADRFVRAERAAMQAPVKLLLPLLAFIFPCTFIVIAIPIAARLTGQGGP